MAVITYEGENFAVPEGHSVLDLLLEQGVEVAHGCHSGVCQSCLMRCEKGDPGEQAQEGLRDAQREQGMFLACRCFPKEDMVVVGRDASALSQPAELMARRSLSGSVVELTLRPMVPFRYRPGQYMTLLRNNSVARSYSLASVPGLDDRLLLQVSRVSGGQMSHWLHDELQPGGVIHFQGPFGNCVYEPSSADQALLMVATGTGLSPLFGIVRDALAQGHAGKIHLVHGGRSTDELYLCTELRAIARTHPNFHYHSSVLEGDSLDEECSLLPVDEVVRRLAPRLRGWRVYLCGSADMVARLQRQVYLAGASMGDILADPFN